MQYTSLAPTNDHAVPATADAPYEVRMRYTEVPKPEKTTILHVGSADRQTFVVREDLLVTYSDFFEAAVESGLNESKERCVNLPEDDQVIFELFVHFLVHGFVYSARDDDGDDDDGCTTGEGPPNDADKE